MILTSTNHKVTAELLSDFDAEEKALLDATLSKIRKHVDKNIEGSSDPEKISKLLNFRWYINTSLKA